MSRLTVGLLRLICIGLAVLIGRCALIKRHPAEDQTRRDPPADAVLYEVHTQSANSCRADRGSPERRAACARKIAPPASYKAHNGDSSMCRSWPKLAKIRLGTLNDLLAETTDYETGITLDYIHDSVKANAVWLMPIFPNNDRWQIPDEKTESCDHLGSPYAVRDYLHVSADLDRKCIAGGAEPCWGDDAFAQVIAKAHRLGMTVYLDLALNHFGNEYVFYDYEDFTPIVDRIARGENLDELWDFKKTHDPKLLAPKILSRPEQLQSLIASNGVASRIDRELRAACPRFGDADRLKFFSAWRDMLDWERKTFDCASASAPGSAPPGFYLRSFGDPESLPKNAAGKNYSQLKNWPDVDFLYLIDAPASRDRPGSAVALQAFTRNREYLFRIVNYWVAQGVDGFRLDHTTDYDSGLGDNVWRYIISKAKYYDVLRRGGSGAGPVFIAEEFHDRGRMDQVVDAMIQGYAFEMRTTKSASAMERILNHEHQRSVVVRSLESHDDSRVGFAAGLDPMTAAVFWGIGATTRGTPVILMGQEFAEKDQISFRRAGVLNERHSESAEKRKEKTVLLAFYRAMNRARLDENNRALRSSRGEFLRRPDGSLNEDIFAQLKWDEGGARPILAFHLLRPSPQSISDEYVIPQQLAAQFAFKDDAEYKLIDTFTQGETIPCKRGKEMRSSIPIRFAPPQRVQWLRLEECAPRTVAAP